MGKSLVSCFYDSQCRRYGDSVDSTVEELYVNWLGLRVGGHPEVSLHSSDEPGELSQ